MASVTFASDEMLKLKLLKFPWVNWSEVARERLLTREKLLEIRDRLDSKEEKELIKWSVELGRKINKNGFKRLLSKLSPKEREELLR